MIKFINSHFREIIVFGVVLQLLISLITYHPDVRAFVLASKFISAGEITSFYDHVSQLPTNDPIKQIYHDDIFIYPPLGYLYSSIVYLPFSSFTSSFTDKFLLNDNAFLKGQAFSPLLLIYKLPSLIGSWLTLWLIMKLFQSKERARLAGVLWILSPTTLLVSSAMGQSDTLVVFFILLAFYLYKNEKLSWSNVALGLSALVKPIALVVIPILAIDSFKKGGPKLAFKNAVIGFGTYLLGIAPYLHSPAFKMYALDATHTNKSIQAGIQIASGNVIPWYFIVITILALMVLYKKISVLSIFLVSILGSLAFNHFHPQWFLWVVPFLIIYAIENQRLSLFFILILSWVSVWLSFDPSLHIGSFLVLRDLFPPTAGSPLNIPIVVSLARSTILASLIFLLYDSRET
jgi:hypothetical protein